jgi:hypothetical protein
MNKGIRRTARQTTVAATPAAAVRPETCPSWCAQHHNGHTPDGTRLWWHERVREIATITGGKVFVTAVAPDGNIAYLTITSEGSTGRFLTQEARAIAAALQEASDDIDDWDDVRCDNTPWESPAEGTVV